MGDDGEVTDRLPTGTFVVVSGPPASGKTTLARGIAPALGLPLIAKDTIKQALMTVLPVPDVETSRVIGTASVAAMLAVAAETAGAVLESVWHRSHAKTGLHRLGGNIVEVFCRCSPGIVAQRYAARAGTRAAGHFDADRTVAELWNDEVAQPVAGGWPVIEIGTDSPVELNPLVVRIRAAANAARHDRV
jgi:predicted kinase